MQKQNRSPSMSKCLYSQAPKCWYDCSQALLSANNAQKEGLFNCAEDWASQTCLSNCTENTALNHSVLSNDTPTLKLQNSCASYSKKIRLRAHT
eukprot:1159930-Pelagomonas_calceolata.AAC.6